MNMNRSPDPVPAPLVMTCGNCCNAIKSTRTVGGIVCVALPPSVLPRPHDMGVNVYPELPADRLGCRVLWNVNAQLFHLLGQAVTLAAGSEDVERGKPESSTEGDGGA